MSASPRLDPLGPLRITTARSEAGGERGGIAVLVISALVFAMVIAVGATAAAAGAFRPKSATQTVVFTVAAPYSPGAADAAPVTVAPVVPKGLTRADPPAEGNWTAARGREIARRAVAWFNWPYTFDGGDANGPTFGVAVDASSRNDASVRGFDCSGLVIYAMAPWKQLSHDASSQYSEAGSVHPSLSSLLPGDLLFWSKDGTIGGIGHVAIYVGNGEVIQAPYSGAYIDVVPIDQVESGRIGVTRPLS